MTVTMSGGKHLSGRYITADCNSHMQTRYHSKDSDFLKITVCQYLSVYRLYTTRRNITNTCYTVYQRIATPYIWKTLRYGSCAIVTVSICKHLPCRDIYNNITFHLYQEFIWNTFPSF